MANAAEITTNLKDTMITDTDRAAIDAHYRAQTAKQVLGAMDAIAAKFTKIKSILEAAQKKAAQQPHVANHFAYRENVFRMAIEAVMKELC